MYVYTMTQFVVLLIFQHISHTHRLHSQVIKGPQQYLDLNNNNFQVICPAGIKQEDLNFIMLEIQIKII